GFKHIKHPSENSFSDDTVKLLKHGYYASVSYVDACVGRLLDELKRLDLYENTIVIIWGDHGWKLGEHNSWCKQTNYEIDTHVPMIIYAPQIKAKGQECDGFTELVDIFPTLCELAGVNVPAYLQGTSVAPLLDKPDLPWKNAVFSQFHRRPRITPDGKRYMGYSMRTGQYHFIEWYYWDNKNKVSTELAGLELYDLNLDPDENNNIANLKQNIELTKKLSNQLSKGWKEAVPKN
ncbi:sulfatase/phosphatase domain-containing protein, partial [Bacteroidota bacterium]